MDNNTPIQMFDVLWSAGKHSLCAQVNGDRFRSIGQFEDPAELLDAASRLPRDANVWWGVHGMEPPQRGRGGVEHVVEVTTLCADFDWADPEAHKDALLPTEDEVRAVVATMQPKPTVVVSSGHGLQAYWGLVEGLDRECGEQLSEGFFRWVEAEYGLHNDRVDLASVLRLPGTFNNKAEPVEVTIEYIDAECGYFAAWLFDNCWVPAPQARSLASVPVAVPHSPTAVQVSALTPAADGESPLEWLNRTFDSAACLMRLGWQPVQGHSHTEQQWTRPGKDPRQGTSATLHLDTGAVNIFSTTLDPIYTMVGLAGKGCVTLKPADLWMVENGISSPSEASRLVRQQMSPREAGVVVETPPASTGQDSAVMMAVSSLNLPDEFWGRRGWLAHIRAAAHHRQASADAILGAVIARYAATIPPAYSIPPIIMTASTFDHISVLVAESSGGKSGAMAIARELFPGPSARKDMVWEWPVSSGEGLVSAFFEMVSEEDSSGKKVLKNKKTKTAVHFSVDEALGLVQMSARQGTTIGSVLCTAWSGGDPGQGNASADRQRVGMVPGSYRMAGVAAIQLSLGHRLLEDTFVQQGLSGRLVFFAAEDPSIPHWTTRPDWPGTLDLPVHPTMPVEVAYDRAIQEEILEQNHQKMTKQVQIAPIDGHLNLVRLKLSGVFALMDARTAVTYDDWDLAGQALKSHLALRGRMMAARKQANYDATVTKATAQAVFEDVKDDLKERRAVGSLRATILRHVPKGGIAQGQLRKVTTSKLTRHRFEVALANAVAEGELEIRDGHVYKV